MTSEFFPQAWTNSQLIYYYFPRERRRSYCQVLYDASENAAKFMTYMFLMAGPLIYSSKKFCDELTILRNPEVTDLISIAIKTVIHAMDYVKIVDSSQTPLTLYHDLIIISADILSRKDYVEIDAIHLQDLSEDQIRVRQSITCELTTAFSTKMMDRKAQFVAEDLLTWLERTL